MDRNVKLGFAIIIISVLVIVMGFLANGWQTTGIDSKGLKEFFNWRGNADINRTAEAPGALRPDKPLKAYGVTRKPIGPKTDKKKIIARAPRRATHKEYMRIESSGAPEQTKVDIIVRRGKSRLAEVNESAASNNIYGDWENSAANEEVREIREAARRQNPEIFAKRTTRAVGVSPLRNQGTVLGAGSSRNNIGRTTAKKPARSASRSGGKIYTVVKGDYLLKISKKVYGAERHWRKIYNANRNKFSGDTKRVMPGIKLYIPPIAASAPTKRETREVRTVAGESGLYTVKTSDTLTRIAIAHYKDPNKWVLIYKANKDIINDPDILISGTRIRLP